MEHPRQRTRALGLAAGLLLSAGAAWWSARPGGTSTPAGVPIDPAILERVRTWEAALLESVPRGSRRAGTPAPDSWRAIRRERPQSLAAFEADLRADPPAASGRIYLVALEPLPEPYDRLLDEVVAFCEAWFGRPTSGLATSFAAADLVPSRHTSHGRQRSSRALLEGPLAAVRPADALAVVGFTMEDLWPGSGWSFVFGHASREHRTAVVSFHRLGDVAVEPRNVLARVLKTTSHECGHVLGMRHCTQFECNQAGVRTRAEHDTRPAHLCPLCRAKLESALAWAGIERDVALLAYYATRELRREAVFVIRRLRRIGVVVERAPPAVDLTARAPSGAPRGLR